MEIKPTLKKIGKTIAASIAVLASLPFAFVDTVIEEGRSIWCPETKNSHKDNLPDLYDEDHMKFDT